MLRSGDALDGLLGGLPTSSSTLAVSASTMPSYGAAFAAARPAVYARGAPFAGAAAAPYPHASTRGGVPNAMLSPGSSALNLLTAQVGNVDGGGGNAQRGGRGLYAEAQRTSPRSNNAAIAYAAAAKAALFAPTATTTTVARPAYATAAAAALPGGRENTGVGATNGARVAPAWLRGGGLDGGAPATTTTRTRIAAPSGSAKWGLTPMGTLIPRYNTVSGGSSVGGAVGGGGGGGSSRLAQSALRGLTATGPAKGSQSGALFF